MKILRKYVPPVWIAPCVILMALLHYLFPITIYLDSPWHYLGFIPLVLSLFFTGSAAKLLARMGTTISPSGHPEKLVTSGLYRFTRNPMYLGMSLIVLGFAMFFGSLSSLLPVIIFMLITQRLFIVNEEALLLAEFGEEYKLYRASVRRWF